MMQRLMENRLLRRLLSLLRFIRFVCRRFVQDGCSYSAASLTITTLLALVPIMIVALKVLSILPAYDQLSEQIQNFIFSNFVASASQATNSTIQHYLQLFAQQATKLSIVGLAILFLAGIVLMNTIGRALNMIWRTRFGWHNIAAIGRYILVLICVPLLMGLSIVASSYLFSLPYFSEGVRHLKLLHFLPLAATFLALMLLYLAIPNYRVRWRDATFGAIVAAGMFEFAKSAFGFYIVHFTRYQVLYGAFASLPIFLLWLYISWMIVLFGAEIAHAAGLRHQFGHGPRFEPFSQAYNWLILLRDAQSQGKKMDLTRLLSIDKKAYQLSPDEMLKHLHKVGYIRQGYNGKIRLCCNVDKLTLYDMYRDLPWRLPQMDKKLQHIWQPELYQRLQQADQQLRKNLDLPLLTDDKKNC